MIKKNRSTASDVAKKAGVSRWTVTRSFLNEDCVSEATREKVKKIAAEMGYMPNLVARSLIKRQTGMIAIVVDNFMNYYFYQLMREISKQLQEQNLLPILINIEDIINIKTIKQAEQFQVDGIIFLGSFFNDYLIRLSKINNMIPVIVIGRDVSHLGVRVISVDNYLAGQEIASLFLSLGYTSFAYIGAPIDDLAKRQRFNGFSDMLNMHNKNINFNLEIEQYNIIQSYKMVKSFLEKNSFSMGVDAIFCENDTLAIGVIDALREKNLNEKIAIVGFDNIQLGASTSYNLTTYDQKVEILAKEAINMIYHYENNIYIKGELVLRQSHKNN
ncbi:LacI family DNA-binding transcriptional regulator [Gilliamella sp. wkB112]|uniref:LacI family DNA-binding transcriptional regulator n=1 Tax=Gilliamella sp. wkB112 TaxID=3120257 RepID=UPI00080DA784|nr:LacI family DNA-binding transcriptional regulator [Gilliamella apicola]OCG01678.1 hypothetical protein A9G12_11905 [Gilliamella apicola]